MKKILVISDPLVQFNIKTDTSYLLMLTAKDMGCFVYSAMVDQVYSLNDQAFADVIELNFTHGLDEIHSTNKWFSQGATLNKVNLSEFDAVFVRNDPPFNMEYYYLTQTLSLAVRAGVKVINNPDKLRNFNEKLSILNFPELITDTLVSKNKQVLHEFVKEHQVCVIKPIDMMAGRGVLQLSHDDPNLKAILELSTNYFSQTVMLQKFIPEVVNGDKRIFIIHGRVIEYCLYRIPASGEIRANIAAGGHGEVHPLSGIDHQIASKVSTWMRENDILFAGIDIIGNFLTEINITSPTGAQQIYHHQGINIPKLLLEEI